MAVVLEQGDDPVADDHAEAERHRVDRREPVEPAVAEEARVRAARPRAARCASQQARARAATAQTAGDDDRAEVRRAPAEPVGERRARRRLRSRARAPTHRRRGPAGTASRRARGCSRCRRRTRSRCRARRSPRPRKASHACGAGSDTAFPTRMRPSPTSALVRAPKRSAARPPGTCITMCTTNCTVTKSPIVVRLTPYACESRVAIGPRSAMFQPTAMPTPMPPMRSTTREPKASHPSEAT